MISKIESSAAEHLQQGNMIRVSPPFMLVQDEHGHCFTRAISCLFLVKTLVADWRLWSYPLSLGSQLRLENIIVLDFKASTSRCAVARVQHLGQKHVLRNSRREEGGAQRNTPFFGCATVFAARRRKKKARHFPASDHQAKKKWACFYAIFC